MTTTADGRRLIITRSPRGAPTTYRVTDAGSTYPLFAGDWEQCRLWVKMRQEADREANRRRMLAHLSAELCHTS